MTLSRLLPLSAVFTEHCIFCVLLKAGHTLDNIKADTEPYLSPLQQPERCKLILRLVVNNYLFKHSSKAWSRGHFAPVNRVGASLAPNFKYQACLIVLIGYWAASDGIPSVVNEKCKLGIVSQDVTHILALG